MRMLLLVAVVAASSNSIVATTHSQEPELKQLADSLLTQLRLRGKSPAAVIPFVNEDYGPAFSRHIVDRLIVFLSRGTDFELVARDRVEETYAELNLALARQYDSSTFARIGKRLGALTLIRGSYTVQAGAASVSIVAQLIDVETGRVVGGELANVPYTADIRAMLAPVSGPPLKSGDTSPLPERANSSSTSSALPSFRNDFLQVSVQSVAIRGRQANLALVFENRSANEEFLSTDCCPGASLVDSSASNRWRFDYNNSSGLTYQSRFRRDEPYRSEDMANMTRLAPGSKQAVVIRFDGIDSAGKPPATVSFSMPVFRRRGESVETFSVGISGIPVTSPQD